jgi:hypothetical protein
MMKIGRETMDLDFLLTHIQSGTGQLQKVFEQILFARGIDGFAFSFDAIELLSQPHMQYPGYRIVLKAEFAKMRDKIQIDVGMGDHVEPSMRKIQLMQYCGKALFENDVALLAYPIEAIFSEKLETILSKGARNSRMKDFHDLLLLIRSGQMLDSDKLKTTIPSTFAGRGTLLRSIEFDAMGLQALQRLWTAHLRGLGDHDLDLPLEISRGIEEINDYLSSIKTPLIADQKPG